MELEDVVERVARVQADASRTSVNAAAKQNERSDTLDRATSFAAALDDARITAAHVDAFARAGNASTTLHSVTSCSTAPTPWST
jgi:hypothetical protein